MPSKMQFYAQMADQAAKQITGSYQSWISFLQTAGRMYKYPYNEQVMIHAQRPDATACAEYDFWNRQWGRYVRRGSKGIALIDTSGENPRLRYVFDVSDTGTRENSRAVRLWELERNTNPRFGICWSAATAFPVKTDCGISLKPSPRSSRTNTGTSISATFSTTLRIRIWKSTIYTTSEYSSATPRRSVSPMR